MSPPSTTETEAAFAAAAKKRAEAAAKAKKKRPAWQTGCLIATPFVLIVLAIVLRIAGFEAFSMEGPSMEPFIANGDRFVIAKYAYGLFLPFSDEASTTWASPSPGDVVVVKSPADDIDIVKRVIAVSGQTVEIRNGVVYVDDVALSADEGQIIEDRGQRTVCRDERLGDITYATIWDEQSPPGDHPPVAVPEGQAYVLGDHRDRSNDSRFFGAVPIGRFKGRYALHYVSVEPRLSCP